MDLDGVGRVILTDELRRTQLICAQWPVLVLQLYIPPQCLTDDSF